MNRQLLALTLLLSMTLYASGNGCYRGQRSTYSTYSTPSYSYSYPSTSYSYSTPAYVAPAKPTYDYAEYQFLLALPLVKLPAYGAVYTAPPPTLPGQQQPNPTPPNGTQHQPPLRSVPGQASPFEEAIIKELKELGKGLKDLGDRVDRIERTRNYPGPEVYPPKPQLPKSQQTPPEKLPPPDVEKAFLKVNAESCIMCHGRSNVAKQIASREAEGKKPLTTFVFTEDDGTPVLLTPEMREEVQRQLIAVTMPMVKKGVKELTKESSGVIFNELDRQIRVSSKTVSRK